MSQIAILHSFTRGTGKSNLATNLAALSAGMGRRVGIIDANLPAPSLHLLFRMNDVNGGSVASTAGATGRGYSLNDYLEGACSIQHSAYEIARPADLAGSSGGAIFLVPASTQPAKIARASRQGYDVEQLYQGFQQLQTTLKLDVLIVDTQAGLNEDTLSLMAISDTLALVLRPDKQDYQGTAVILDVARGLEMRHIFLLVNKNPAAFDPSEVKAQMEQTYACEVAAVLPHSDEILAMASEGVFVWKYPHHPVTAQLASIAARLNTYP